MPINPQSTKLAVAKDRLDAADNRQICLIHAPSKARGEPGSLAGQVQSFCELRNSAKKQQLAGMFVGPRPAAIDKFPRRISGICSRGRTESCWWRISRYRLDLRRPSPRTWPPESNIST